jgi:hypothetical protein
MPISTLNPKDADMTIIFLAPNAIKYNYPTSDPFFSANFYVELGSYNGVNLSYFSGDEYVSAMACTDQYQYCNIASGTEEPECTALTGYQQAFAGLNSTRLNLNNIQYGIASRIALTSRTLSTYHSISGRGAAALRAQETIYDRVQQIPLPSNQWQIELDSWFATSLAKLQHSIVEYAAPTVRKQDMPVGTYLQQPFDTVSKAMCYSQKVSLTGSTVSFSVLGLSIILAVGGMIVLVYLLLEPVVGWLQRRYGWGEYRRVRWIMDDKFQVQRMAFEESGMGGQWMNLDEGVPFTSDKMVKFGDLHGVDFSAPRLSGQRGKQAEAEVMLVPTPPYPVHD